MAKTQDPRVKKLILMSPPDMISLMEVESYHQDLLKEANQLIAEGKGEEFLSKKVWDWYFLSANTYVDIFNRNNPADVFNFYYTTSSVVKCAVPENGDFVKCDLWKEVADVCDIPYDIVIILQRREGGGSNGGPWVQTAAYTNTTFIHEIGHSFGFRDWDDLRLPIGPNDCTSLDCCGGTICPFQDYRSASTL